MLNCARACACRAVQLRTWPHRHVRTDVCVDRCHLTYSTAPDTAPVRGRCAIRFNEATAPADATIHLNPARSLQAPCGPNNSITTRSCRWRHGSGQGGARQGGSHCIAQNCLARGQQSNTSELEVARCTRSAHRNKAVNSSARAPSLCFAHSFLYIGCHHACVLAPKTLLVFCLSTRHCFKLLREPTGSSHALEFFTKAERAEDLHAVSSR